MMQQAEYSVSSCFQGAEVYLSDKARAQENAEGPHPDARTLMPAPRCPDVLWEGS